MAQPPPSDKSTPPPERGRGWKNLPPEEIAHIVARRATIEQAKGVLMFIYDIDADQAFEMLRCRSRTTQVQVCLFAGQLIKDVLALTPDQRRDLRSTCNRLLLTVHQRLRPSDEAS
jgi:hypothetical protein